MRLLPALRLAIAAGPVSAQDRAAQIAAAEAATGPMEVMGIALTQCLSWGPDAAAADLARAGWSSDVIDEVTTLSRDGVTLALTPGDGWCDIYSPDVRQEDARQLAEYVLVTYFGGPLSENKDDLGCTVLWSETSAAAAITLAGPGSDESSCVDTGQPGAALNLFIQ